MLRVAAVVALVLAFSSCGPRDKPTGTSGDPVDVCERVGDVCKLDKARLGVCSRKHQGDGFACVSQH